MSSRVYWALVQSCCACKLQKSLTILINTGSCFTITVFFCQLCGNFFLSIQTLEMSVKQQGGVVLGGVGEKRSLTFTPVNILLRAALHVHGYAHKLIILSFQDAFFKIVLNECKVRVGNTCYLHNVAFHDVKTAFSCVGSCRLVVELVRLAQNQFVFSFPKWISKQGHRMQINIAITAFGLICTGAIEVPYG